MTTKVKAGLLSSYEDPFVGTAEDHFELLLEYWRQWGVELKGFFEKIMTQIPLLGLVGMAGGSMPCPCHRGPRASQIPHVPSKSLHLSQTNVLMLMSFGGR